MFLIFGKLYKLSVSNEDTKNDKNLSDIYYYMGKLKKDSKIMIFVSKNEDVNTGESHELYINSYDDNIIVYNENNAEIYDNYSELVVERIYEN